MRELERTTRANATAFVELAREAGLSRTDAGGLLGVDPSTLASWENADDALRPRGRPPITGSIVTRSELVTLMLLVGPHVGVTTIHQHFAAEISRREVAALVGRLRSDIDGALEGALSVLTWTRPGAVWAVDWKAPPAPVDGVFASILVVRDLASGALLLALPVREATAEVVAAALTALVLEHGQPLVLKADNGSNLICEEAQTPMRAGGVVLLRSPPATPSYNGACEAGIGSLATRTHHEASRHGRPGRWSSDDVEAARRQANELTRHEHFAGQTAADVWAARAAITTAERDAFRASVAHHREAVARDLAARSKGALDERAQHVVDRIAIKTALVERGFLSIRGRAECLHN